MSNITDHIHIDALVFGGQGIGTRPDGKKIFVWNALPGEEVAVEIQKDKKDYAAGIAVDVRHPAPERIVPQEESYLSTSPWQIMTPAYEDQQKKVLAAAVYQRIGGIEVPDQKIISDQTAFFGYRNKMEFSFTLNEKGKISLAFFIRGTKDKIAVHESQLADDPINQTAKKVITWIREQHLVIGSMKSLLIRSNGKETIAALFIKDELQFKTYPALDETLTGFQLYYSTHKSPASVPTKLLHQSGSELLAMPLGHITLFGGIFNFFQINVPLFLHALDVIKSHIPADTKIVDMYAGVGAIGLFLADHAKEIICVESHQQAVGLCQKNMVQNNITNATAIHSLAEHALEYIPSEGTLIVDPPRAGLHGDVIAKILAQQPDQIIYLSCNLSTHARDLKLLQEVYEVQDLSLYNFFPRTPHIEALAILKKKTDQVNDR